MKCVFYVGEKFLEVGAMLYLFGLYYVCVFLKKNNNLLWIIYNIFLFTYYTSESENY